VPPASSRETQDHSRSLPNLGITLVLYMVFTISTGTIKTLWTVTLLYNTTLAEFRQSGFRRVLGVKPRKVLMPKLHGKPLVSKLLQRCFPFFVKFHGFLSQKVSPLAKKIIL
jgi:hypothetical protein